MEEKMRVTFVSNYGIRSNLARGAFLSAAKEHKIGNNVEARIASSDSFSPEQLSKSHRIVVFSDEMEKLVRKKLHPKFHSRIRQWPTADLFSLRGSELAHNLAKELKKELDKKERIASEAKAEKDLEHATARIRSRQIIKVLVVCVRGKERSKEMTSQINESLKKHKISDFVEVDFKGTRDLHWDPDPLYNADHIILCGEDVQNDMPKLPVTPLGKKETWTSETVFGKYAKTSKAEEFVRGLKERLIKDGLVKNKA